MDEGWAEVLAGWDDDERHRAYLARCADLAALAAAGARYRAVLEARPDDAVARRWRDEVIRRAAVAGLAAIPREAPGLRVPRWVRAALVGVLVLALAALVAAGVRAFSSLSLSGGRP